MPAALAVVLLLPRNAVIAVLLAYRKLISPLYGDVCRYYPSCSAYGLGSVQQRGVAVGSVLTVWRILRCNPWARGGIDDVRAPRRFRYRVTPRGFVAPAAPLPASAAPAAAPASVRDADTGADSAAEAQPAEPVLCTAGAHRHSPVHASSSARTPAPSRKD